MGKPTKTFRLNPQALDKLDALHDYTGSTHTAIVEQALAVYAAFLEHGLPLPADAASAQQTLERPSAPAPTIYERDGHTYQFGFPIAGLPERGSDPCPCGSGKRFNGCHNKDFRLAVKAGLTRRDWAHPRPGVNGATPPSYVHTGHLLASAV